MCGNSKDSKASCKLTGIRGIWLKPKSYTVTVLEIMNEEMLKNIEFSNETK